MVRRFRGRTPQCWRIGDQHCTLVQLDPPRTARRRFTCKQAVGRAEKLLAIERRCVRGKRGVRQLQNTIRNPQQFSGGFRIAGFGADDNARIGQLPNFIHVRDHDQLHINKRPGNDQCCKKFRLWACRIPERRIAARPR
jgi:hypothetical protein